MSKIHKCDECGFRFGDGEETRTLHRGCHHDLVETAGKVTKLDSALSEIGRANLMDELESWEAYLRAPERNNIMTANAVQKLRETLITLFF